MFQVYARSDRKKNPTPIDVDYLSMEEIKSLHSGDTIHILDQNDRLARVKITSIKTWKRKPDIEIHVKYGLYEYFTINVIDASPDMPLVKIIYKDN